MLHPSPLTLISLHFIIPREITLHKIAYRGYHVNSPPETFFSDKKGGDSCDIGFLNYFPYKPIFDLTPISAKKGVRINRGEVKVISTVNVSNVHRTFRILSPFTIP